MTTFQFNAEFRASKDELQGRTDAAAGWGKPRGDTVDDECASGRVMPNAGRIGDGKTCDGSGMAKRVMDRGRRTFDGSCDNERPADRATTKRTADRFISGTTRRAALISASGDGRHSMNAAVRAVRDVRSTADDARLVPTPSSIFYSPFSILHPPPHHVPRPDV
jgi:hypothetical protein